MLSGNWMADKRGQTGPKRLTRGKAEAKITQLFLDAVAVA
jgi:hypothetical protein